MFKLQNNSKCWFGAILSSGVLESTNPYAVLVSFKSLIQIASANDKRVIHKTFRSASGLVWKILIFVSANQTNLSVNA